MIAARYYVPKEEILHAPFGFSFVFLTNLLCAALADRLTGTYDMFPTRIRSTAIARFYWEVGNYWELTYRGVHQPLDPHGDPVDGACQAKPEIRNIDRSAIWMGCSGIRTFCTAGSSEKSLVSSSYCSPGVTVSRSRHMLDRIYSTSMSRLHDSQNPRPESGQLASGSPRDSPTRLPRTAL